MAAMGENTGGNNGYVNFYDVENKTVLKESEHFRMASLEWDPSGRYVVTAVNQPIDGSHWKAQMDNGYRLWSFQVYKHNLSCTIYTLSAFSACVSSRVVVSSQ
jgi:Eukaryotic translation initiation factor eIF2A